jgi:hypothetical protein
MNLLEQMNAAEYKKLLEFEKQYPGLGKDLKKTLTEKIIVTTLTVDECINLCQALGFPWSSLFNEVFNAFKSKP